jgi:hypothetical protein
VMQIQIPLLDSTIYTFPYTSRSLFLINYLYELKHCLLVRAFYLAFKINSKPWCLWVWFPKISIMLVKLYEQISQVLVHRIC